MTALDRVGPSESQAMAVYGDSRTASVLPKARAAADSPYLTDMWSSQDRRLRQRAMGPPRGVDALVAWFRARVEEEEPATLHKAEIWVDRVSGKEREDGVLPVGGSLIGSLAFAEPFRRRLEETPHQKDRFDRELERPFGSAMDSLRKKRRWGHDALVALINVAHFDWRSLADRAMYGRRHRDDGTTERFLVRYMDEGVLRDVLEATLLELWSLYTEREPIARGSP